ncbi:chorismate mutase [Temperatibacter marinus]|uniref:chorismate mutase n=1 Tax=Temperatibacter marinus TaxID=1456591 RepID=A0AA52HA22_9PROT|nr:chorismate mutase [Temperatibacter marinus]WND02270.1 chorismate mutase [Temperatibacter marinus]
MARSCTTMAEVREEIDRVDRLIVPLLAERLEYIKQAGRIKQDRNVVRDNWRIEDVVSKCKATASSLDADEKMVEDIYRFIIEWSINHEFDVWDDIHK